MVGALAGLTTKNNEIGFIGGVELPTIQKFEDGFRQGAKHVNSEVNIQVDYAGSFGNPDEAENIANTFIGNGGDIIYHAAGGSGLGLFNAVETKKNVYAIGVDSNQNWISAGNIIASMVKRVDEAVYNTVEDVVRNEFEGGNNIEYDLAKEGVGITPLKVKVDNSILSELTEEEINTIENMKENVTATYANEIETIKQDIINDKIKIE